jgi:hypothetical protein
MFFFGNSGSGSRAHALYGPGIVAAREEEIPGWPWAARGLDSLYAPRPGRAGDEPLGLATITRHEGWTVLAMWDRSGDSRRGSNCAFVSRGEHTVSTMVAQCEKHFPEMWRRINKQATVKLA